MNGPDNRQVLDAIMPASNFIRHLSGMPLLPYVDDECDVDDDDDIMNYDSDDDDPWSSLDDDKDLLNSDCLSSNE